jgi:carbamoylphosphate synthase large subunit
VQGAQEEGSGRAGELEPGDDHDRPQFADATYVEPLTVDIVAKITSASGRTLRRTIGGQTRLDLTI